MAQDPYTDGSGFTAPPVLDYGLQFRDYGSYGLRQYGGWVREEFLQALVGREAARVYREMLDNSATVGAMVFAITQAMRKVEWRIEPANDSAKAQAEADFAESLMHDMSHTWDDFVTEALTMLPYGFAAHEIVYKKRLGPQEEQPGGDPLTEIPSSRHNDGRIGWRRLPIRGQDTVIKWFFDQNGQIRGLTQQPWIGTLIDIPIEKMLLFRPTAHKNNPEGKSILRNSYRSYYLTKRFEELEAVLFERMGGFPVMYIPTSLMEAAAAPNAPPAALQAYNYYKKLVTNVRIDEQMGAVLPSDVYKDAEGKPSAVRMYEFKLITPEHARGNVEIGKTIERHKIDMLMSLLCDFIVMGHEVRGTNNLAISKVDMFFQAIESWLDSIAEVITRYGLARIWKLNNLNPDLMPQFKPDLSQRIDLDGLGGFISNLAAAGMPLFPDDELQTFLRDAAGLPDVTDPKAVAAAAQAVRQGGSDTAKKMMMAAVAKEIVKRRNNV